MTAPLMSPSPATTRTTPRRTGGLSIERRLPLLMAAVIVGVVTVTLLLTYRALALTARDTATTRLREVGATLARTLETTTRTRSTMMSRVLRDDAVIAALRRVAADTAALPDSTERSVLQTALEKLKLQSDSGLPTELWTSDGRRLAATGERPAPVPVLQPERAELPPPGSLRTVSDSMRVGRPFLADGRVYYHTVVPIDDGGERLGFLVTLRRITGSVRLAAQLRALSGEDVSLYVHQPGSPLWASLTGAPSGPPAATDEPDVVARPETGELLAVSVPVRGGPWTLTLEEPLAAVLSRPRAALLEQATLGVVLTLLGTLAAWVIGRRIARPIATITDAAEAVARGDFGAQVNTGGHDELGRLARSFNAMAREVDASQRALERQYVEAREVASELASTNHSLQAAMHAVEEARDAAEQANRAKSDFLAVMSHELRTPLNAIGGYAELMQLGIYGGVTAEQAHALERITRSQQHLLGLINDVLNFAKLNAAKVQFDIRDVSLSDALTAVEAMIAPQIAAKSHRYVCLLCEPTLTVRADRDKLQQIVLNLLSNAVKFTPNGGTIAVECSADDDTVRIAVRDSGVGIPADRMRHVFEPFVQVDRALNRPHEGVGLGLAISHDLALGMNGALVAESTPGEGSTFTLVLPRGAHVRSLDEPMARVAGASN